VAKTLLAVDDSATMRKVLEITFSGEDFHVLTAHNYESALSKAGEGPDVLVVDTVLDGEDGYALAKQLRQRLPGAALILLSSRYNAYDPAKGKDAGADDFMDKPFDTQQMIDKVKKAVAARSAAGPAPTVSAEPTAGAPHRAPAPVAAAPAPAPAPTPKPVPAAPAPPAPGAAPAKRASTLLFSVDPNAAPAQAAPTAAPPAPAPAAPVAVSASASAAASELAPQLAGLGLTPEQANAVLALSRELVEKVVWEVVPVLAETLIKEEIARLTKEG
jgi:CheY-like chemotaxis protein